MRPLIADSMQKESTSGGSRWMVSFFIRRDDEDDVIPFIYDSVKTRFEDWARDKIDRRNYKFRTSYISFKHREDALLAYLAFK